MLFPWSFTTLYLQQIRGATNTIQKFFSSVNEGDLKPIVVTHSSGNHAQAAALAAKWSNIPAHIVMPSNSPKVKVDAVKDYGGSITFCEPNEQVYVKSGGAWVAGWPGSK